MINIKGLAKELKIYNTELVKDLVNVDAESVDFPFVLRLMFLNCMPTHVFSALKCES